MKERPILFSAPMVRAILAGQKTQTRRAIALPRSRDSFVLEDRGAGWWPYQSDDGESSLCDDGMEHPYTCPYGRPGDRLWVRETWAYGIHALSSQNAEHEGPWVYSADHAAEQGRLCDRWRPSIHMRREASRILLEITSVRVERLQGISEADARAEGATPIPDPCDHVRLSCADIGCSGPQPYRVGFRSLWRDINGPESWDANPWVWVVEFERVQVLQNGPAL